MRLSEIAGRVKGAFRRDATAVGAGLTREISIDRVLNVFEHADDPDDLLKLVGIARHDLLRLESDDEVYAALETRRDACINTPWRIEPGTGEVVDFFHDQLQRWGVQLMSIAWCALPYGYSVGEWVYRSDGGRIVPAKLEEKPIEWFKVDKSGALRFIGPNGSISAEGVPVDTSLKFQFTRHRPTYRNQYGEALLSRAYWPWYFRHNGWQFWGQFLERFGMPLLLGKVSSPKEFVTLMQTMGIDSVIAVDKTSEVTAVTVQGQGQFSDFEAACCRRIQKLVLGQTLTSDTTGKGSYAFGQVHELVRQDRRRTDCLLVSAAVQRWINAMTALNFPGSAPPRFVMEGLTSLSMERADRDVMLATAGIVRFTPAYLQRAYDFEDGDFIVPGRSVAGQKFTYRPVTAHEAPGERVAPGSLGAMPGGGYRLSDGLAVQLRDAPKSGRPSKRFTDQQEQVEQLVENAVARAQWPIDPGKIRGAVLAATGPEDLADRLAVLMGGSDARGFREVLERSLFTAEVLGYVHADQPGSREAKAVARRGTR